MRKVMGPVSSGPKDRCGQFKPGQSGNPAGRPRGERSRLNEAFMKDMLADWEAHGAAAITAFRTERPHEYVKVMAGLVPREFKLEVNEHDELTDAELSARLSAVLRELAERSAEPGAGDEAAEGDQPAGGLSTLQ